MHAYGGQQYSRTLTSMLKDATNANAIGTNKMVDFNTLHPIVAWKPFEKWGIDFITQSA